MRYLMIRQKGFTFIELVIVIVLVGILVTVAARKLGSSIDTAKYEQTKKELDQLANAIVGNPAAYVEGSRVDFGYVGDVGALPPNLDALVQNPGGFATWAGPYIEAGLNGDEFKKDAWNAFYVYVDTLIRSTGSGQNIDKVFARSSASLLNNSVAGVVIDADSDTPGSVYRDSLRILLRYPNGSGSYTTVTTNPNAGGNFSFANVPIGNHTLQVIYLPDSDTLTIPITVVPSSTRKLSLVFPADLW